LVGFAFGLNALFFGVLNGVGLILNFFSQKQK